MFAKLEELFLGVSSFCSFVFVSPPAQDAAVMLASARPALCASRSTADISSIPCNAIFGVAPLHSACDLETRAVKCHHHQCNTSSLCSSTQPPNLCGGGNASPTRALLSLCTSECSSSKPLSRTHCRLHQHCFPYQVKGSVLQCTEAHVG